MQKSRNHIRRVVVRLASYELHKRVIREGGFSLGRTSYRGYEHRIQPNERYGYSGCVAILKSKSLVATHRTRTYLHTYTELC